MDELFIDIETRSRVDLKKFGVYRYAACPDFDILIASWALNDEPVTTALGRDDILAIPGLFDTRVVKKAWNSQFERVCFSRYCRLPLGQYLDPKQWPDVQARSAEWGWPQKLEVAARAMGVPAKDPAGTRLINLFCKPNRKGEFNGPDTHPMEWLEFMAYCDQDVEVLRDLDRKLPSWPTDMERRIFLADQRINDRGIAIDIPMAEAAMVAGQRNQVAQKARFTEITGVDNPNSVPQLNAWATQEELPLPNMQKDTIERALEGDLRPEHREALELRQELALAAPKKFESALGAALPDGRLRGTLKFFGAHTGRWAGRGTQVQNLPRHSFMVEDPKTGKKVHDELNEELTILDLLDGDDISSDDLKRLVRPMFIPGRGHRLFTVVDYSSIEARVIAGLGGEQWALDAFALGRDIYVETAERMSTPDTQLDRAQGKVAVLALGYAGGTKSLRAMGAEGDDDELQLLVNQWRRANSRIVRLWSDLDEAFSETGKVGEYLDLRQTKDRLGRAVHMHLPSGRAITYHGTKWERYVVKDPQTDKLIRKQGWRYADPKFPFNPKMRIGTYGGRLAENATQAVARDIMAEALVRLEDSGFRVVAHVHDEIIVEGEHDVDEIKSIMCHKPDWAYGFPIDGEGFTCRRYRKG